MPGEKARDFKGTFKRLVKYLGKYNLLILGVLLIAAASTVFSIFGPKILGQATTQLFQDVAAQIAGTGSGVDYAAIGTILLRVALLYAISSFLAFSRASSCPVSRLISPTVSGRISLTRSTCCRCNI